MIGDEPPMMSIRVLFAGDFAPCRGFEQEVLAKQEAIFGGAVERIKSSDIAFINLECPLTEHSEAIPKSGPALKASPGTVDALERAGFTVIGLANNHVMDYGERGLRDTMAACHARGLSMVGAGADLASAQRPVIQEIRGVKVAIIAIAEPEFSEAGPGCSGAAPLDPIENHRQITQARALADVVIVTLHGGNEYFPFPRPGLRKLCQFFIDLGVNAVVCHHPHVPGAYEWYKGKPIFYCLGNCVFDAPGKPRDWYFGYMVEFSFDPESKALVGVELIPYEQSVALGGVRLLEGAEKARFLENIEKMRETLEDELKWQREWKNFVRARADQYLKHQYAPRYFKGLGLLWRNMFFRELFFHSSNNLSKFNIIRCESHRELLQESMQLMIHEASTRDSARRSCDHE